MISVQKDTIVYIVCPANSRSGGVELLHQLAFQLKAMQVKVFMLYHSATQEDPVDPFYKKYDIPYVFDLEDEEKNILILPETALAVYYLFPRIRHVIWWLSVDHYISNLATYYQIMLEDPMQEPLADFYQLKDDKAECHLVQSEYARQFLLLNGVREERIAYLSDYLNTAFLEETTIPGEDEKMNVVAYCPNKGLEFTKKLIQASPDLKWFAIENMTPEQVRSLLKSAKVYADFGYHPGKDRIPREAAMCGCCVVTSLRGAAANDTDVPIDREYKFADTEENIPVILDKIREIQRDFSAHSARFDAYRYGIRKEPERFKKDAAHIFVS
ncbi:MAG: hypothetical protein IJP92_17705 [Lachnospiraceae bacterium]|nr:hypothetical protein [Lachnospiraceae bacterium]